MPLGKLIEEFTRRSDKEEWVKGMRKLNSVRNHFAHRAFLLSIEEQKDSEKLKIMAMRANKVRKIVVLCMRDIATEHSGITGEKYYSEIFDEWLE